ncbi:MAG: hypothetical protein RDU25_04505 [Patescibacteria group bacterium]|nr:hypothetical protein [Patescibacteria group bacterium]
MQTQTTQGQDPRNNVFQGLSGILYAACEPIAPSYRIQSTAAAACADAVCPGGLAGKRVLDVGCGFGTTALAIAAHAPAEIVCADTSQVHLNLLEHTFFGSKSLESILRSVEAEKVLGRYFEPTVTFLESMRREFRESRFVRRGGKLRTVLASSLDLTSEMLGGEVDAIVGNNFLHWPVNQRRAEHVKAGVEPIWALAKAQDDALQALVRVKKRDGIVALLEPIDFVTTKDDQAYQDMAEHALANHPAFVALHRGINDLLKTRYDIDRKMPALSPMFTLENMSEVFRRNCLNLLNVAQFERVMPVTYGDALDFMFVRLPMVLGNLDIPFDAKFALAKEIEVRLRFEATEDRKILDTPLHGQYFIFLAK